MLRSGGVRQEMEGVAFGPTGDGGGDRWRQTELNPGGGRRIEGRAVVEGGE